MIFMTVLSTIIQQDATACMAKNGSKSRKLTKSADKEDFSINIHECWLWFSPLSLVISWIHTETHTLDFMYKHWLWSNEQPSCMSMSIFPHIRTHLCINKSVIMIMEISSVGICTVNGTNIWWKRSIYISCVFPQYPSTGVNKNRIYSNMIYIIFIETHAHTSTHAAAVLLYLHTCCLSLSFAQSCPLLRHFHHDRIHAINWNLMLNDKARAT